MTKIEIYDIEAEQIEKLAEEFGLTNAEIVGGLLNMLYHEAYLLGKDATYILGEHI